MDFPIFKGIVQIVHGKGGLSFGKTVVTTIHLCHV